MSQNKEVVVRKGSFQKVAFSSLKKLSCDEGELTLTSERLLLECKKSWSKSFFIRDIRLETWEKNLEIHHAYYDKLLFKLIIDNPEEWEKAFRELNDRYHQESWNKLYERQIKKPEELNRLFEMKQEILKEILAQVMKEHKQFGEKNADFILTVQNLVKTTKNRKLKAFIIAHCYVAWYEWTKSLLLQLYKGRFGKGPQGEELNKFLQSFPSLGVLDTNEWGINANQIRNCVAHERFYYDYKSSELVFRVENKDKRIRVRELHWRLISIAYTYRTLIISLTQKVETGKIHFETDF
jgi:hypothetical protein